MNTIALAQRATRKHATGAVWDASSFVPAAGELIVYDIDSTHSAPRFKVGDGTTTVGNLPFASGYSVGAVVIDSTIAATAWTFDQTSNKYAATLNQGDAAKVKNFMYVAEFELSEPKNLNTPVDITTNNGSVTFEVDVEPEEAWHIYLVLVTEYLPEVIDYPRIAMVRVQVNITQNDWTEQTNSAYVDIADSNIASEMSLLEWEPDPGYDFPYDVSYTTSDGKVRITATDVITTTVSGILTLGIDSASMGTKELEAQVVTSVNGKRGAVEIPEAVESLNGISWEIDTTDWTASTWDSSITTEGYETSTSTSGECYECYVQAVDTNENEAMDGDRFVCSVCIGNPSPLYCIPGKNATGTTADGYMLIQTATKPTGTTQLSGYIRMESTARQVSYKRRTESVPVVDGGVAHTESGGTATIAFNKPFTSAPIVTATIMGSSLDKIWATKVWNITKTGFDLYTSYVDANTSTPTGSAATVSWTAIGS